MALTLLKVRLDGKLRDAAQFIYHRQTRPVIYKLGITTHWVALREPPSVWQWYGTGKVKCVTRKKVREKNLATVAACARPQLTGYERCPWRFSV